MYGVLGTNKHLYHSDAGVSDSDSDGLLDGEELGELKVFGNHEGETVTNSSVNVKGYTPKTKGSFAVYANLRTNPRIAAGEYSKVSLGCFVYVMERY